MSPADSLSRRNFLKLTGAAMGVAAVGGAGAFAAEAARPMIPRQQPTRFTIDVHMHYRNDPNYFPSLLKIYRERNAMACVNGFYHEFPAVAKAAKEHPDVVIPFARILLDDADVLKQIDDLAAQGCKGVGELRNPRYNYDDERYFPIYEKIEAKGWPALFHTGIAGFGALGMPRMRAEFLITIAAKFTNLQIIGAHLGNPDYAEAAEVARWCKNVHLDITGSTLTKLQGNLKAIKDIMWWEGPSQHSASDTEYAFEKLVFGTDEPPENLDKCYRQHEDMYEACLVPEATRKNISGGTMARILKIPVRA
jgi:predicted TIM-barrel fold metal-dependent hydrolase